MPLTISAHNIACDENGLVYVADRENQRIQIFDGDGVFQDQWHDLHRPSGIFLEQAVLPVMYVAEIGPYLEGHRGWPNLYPRISVLDVSEGGAAVAAESGAECRHRVWSRGVSSESDE